MWTIDEALAFIKLIQPKLREYNYHVTMGGSVLNEKQSANDLDLYFLPLEDGSSHPDDRKDFMVADVMSIMHKVTGTFGKSINEGYEHLRSTYNEKIYYVYNGKRIDCFIV